MKALRIELRLYIAEKLMSWAFSIAPQNYEGNEIRISIGRYFSESWLRKFKEEQKHV